MNGPVELHRVRSDIAAHRHPLRLRERIDVPFGSAQARSRTRRANATERRNRFIVDGLVIYALTMHGGELES